MELASRRGNEQAAQMLVQVQSDGSLASSRRRRSTLADMRKDLRDLQKKQHSRWRWRAKVVLVFYTMARIAAGLSFTYLREFVDYHKVCDAVFRPFVTGFGLYFIVHRKDRFSVKNSLHVWSLFTMCCLALPLCDASIVHVLISSNHSPILASVAMLLWEVLCNVLQVYYRGFNLYYVFRGVLNNLYYFLGGFLNISTVFNIPQTLNPINPILLRPLQVYMTILKLRALGWHRTARCCSVLTALGVCWLVVFLGSMCARRLGILVAWSEKMENASLIGCQCCSFTVVVIQCWALCGAARGAMLQARGNEAVWWTACLLYANACMVPLGAALSFVALFAFLQTWNPFRHLSPTLVTLDVSFQVFNVLVLSGMVGSIPMNLETLQRLAELSGFGLASARVAFPGHISRSASDCVVSFPGKYSELWDKAVSRVAREDAFSLACVFLTDRASGLGRHANNPETPGMCWCQQIYGRLPASTYLSVVEVSTDELANHDQTLAFKRADAEAMGQRLLIKRNQTEIEWEQELAEALQDAEARCIENEDRAPWGCQWFEEWKRNVDRAAGLGQTLHVFYFEDSKGKGKMPWDLLANETAKQEARKDSGLGVSQTAEVAYLDKMGLTYVEHDIMEFEAFLTCRTKQPQRTSVQRVCVWHGLTLRVHVHLRT